MSEQEHDPFDPHNLAISQFIMSMRIYDVLMALLQQQNSAVATALLEHHAAGTIVGTQPTLNGQFLTDEENTAEEDTT